MLWGLNVMPQPGGEGKKKKRGGGGGEPKKAQQLNRLSLLLTLTAVFFFTGLTWVLGADGRLDRRDGLVLVGLFLFWQCFHMFDVMKGNVRQNKGFSWGVSIDLALLGLGAWCIYLSTNWLVDWVSGLHTGFISAQYMGWLSGWLMVLPNGLLAFYYARRGNPEVVYTSQVGDGHICIPLCIGIFSLYRPITTPGFFEMGMFLLLCTAGFHFIMVALLGRLPKFAGWLLAAVYLVFLVRGLPR